MSSVKLIFSSMITGLSKMTMSFSGNNGVFLLPYTSKAWPLPELMVSRYTNPVWFLLTPEVSEWRYSFGRSSLRWRDYLRIKLEWNFGFLVLTCPICRYWKAMVTAPYGLLRVLDIRTIRLLFETEFVGVLGMMILVMLSEYPSWFILWMSP